MVPIPLTFQYKHFDDHDSFVDVFLPESDSREPSPIIVYFHGGGLTVGSRKSWFPSWICERALRSGMTFVSADYRLLPPATGSDILEDIKDLFKFLVNDLQRLVNDAGVHTSTNLDTKSFIVVGTSAGGLCAYLAAIHADPKPKALVSLYGMGGDYLQSQYLSVKKEPFFVGRELLDPEEFREFLFPFPPQLKHTSDSPLAYHPPTSATPGYPANLRMQLCRLYLQLGIFLDYYLGEHEPSISLLLRQALKSTTSGESSIPDIARQVIPAVHHSLFPQFNVDSSFPPTFLVHGGNDSAVKVGESENMRRLLEDAGVRVEMVVVSGQEHSFDYQAGSEEKFADLFNRVFAFMVDCAHHDQS